MSCVTASAKRKRHESSLLAELSRERARLRGAINELRERGGAARGL